MKKSFQTLSIPHQDSNDFTIVYNDGNVPVSKFLLGYYSAYFRSIPDFFNAKTYNFTAKYPINHFKDFVAAAQGKEFKIDAENFFSLLYFSATWEVPTVLSIVCSQSNIDINKIIEQLLSSNNEKYTTVLFDIIASHFDDALKSDKFTKISYRNVAQILKSQKLKLNDHNLLYKYLVDRIPSMDTELYELFRYVDLQNLTQEYSSEIFGNFQLMKFFTTFKDSHPPGDIMNDFNEILAQMKSIDKRIKRLEKMKFEEKFESISEQFGDIEERISEEIKTRLREERKEFDPENKLDKKLKQMADILAKKILELEGKIKRQDISQGAHAKEIIVRSQAMNSNFDPIRAEMREMQRMLRVINVKQIGVSEHVNNRAAQKTNNV